MPAIELKTTKEVDRFWRRVVVDDVSDCWIWVGGKRRSGKSLYGHVQLRRQDLLPHRVSYATWRGDPGPELDHLCRQTLCLNPAHLEPVTHSENKKRGFVARGLPTHGPCGHEFTKENTIMEKCRGGYSRKCRMCTYARNASYRKKVQLCRP